MSHRLVTVGADGRSLRAHKPTRGGRVPVNVEGVVWHVMAGSRVVQFTNGGRKGAYVLDPDGSVVMLTAAGEVDVPAHLTGAVKRRYFPE